MAPRTFCSAPALGLKSTYAPEMHFDLCSSAQVVEVANIFSALRAHHKPKFASILEDASHLTHALVKVTLSGVVPLHRQGLCPTTRRNDLAQAREDYGRKIGGALPSR